MLGFPFETIYPQTTSNEIAKNIIGYFGLSTSVEKDNPLAPNDFQLYQNYPNPFNPTTSIKYKVSSICAVTLKVYDILANEVSTLVNEIKSPGNYEIKFNASNLSSGIYFYKLQAGDISSIKKMLLLK
ncbi:MAG: T9SS C-terminal target domain-containing protein [Ignavibacteriales bacterium]|nr:MAG: T9SS C-terminal target domain-containing protein [Ignavibacteriales bacterium]